VSEDWQEYSIDKKEGKQKIWSASGEISKEEYYENGELIEEIVL
jgi:antitoxin component YwqK of YwqJK toxin-antitoxin module